jgi:hypothetical protein
MVIPNERLVSGFCIGWLIMKTSAAAVSHAYLISHICTWIISWLIANYIGWDIK